MVIDVSRTTIRNPQPRYVKTEYLRKSTPKNLSNVFEGGCNRSLEKLGVEVVAIDGKALRGSYDRSSGLKALHMVSVWSNEHRLVLRQTKVSTKSNEITAIPALLEMLDKARLYHYY